MSVTLSINVLNDSANGFKSFRDKINEIRTKSKEELQTLQIIVDIKGSNSEDFNKLCRNAAENYNFRHIADVSRNVLLVIVGYDQPSAEQDKDICQNLQYLYNETKLAIGKVLIKVKNGSDKRKNLEQRLKEYNPSIEIIYDYPVTATAKNRPDPVLDMNFEAKLDGARQTETKGDSKADSFFPFGFTDVSKLGAASAEVQTTKNSQQFFCSPKDIFLMEQKKFNGCGFLERPLPKSAVEIREKLYETELVRLKIKNLSKKSPSMKILAEYSDENVEKFAGFLHKLTDALVNRNIKSSHIITVEITIEFAWIIESLHRNGIINLTILAEENDQRQQDKLVKFFIDAFDEVRLSNFFLENQYMTRDEVDREILRVQEEAKLIPKDRLQAVKNTEAERLLDGYNKILEKCRNDQARVPVLVMMFLANIQRYMDIFEGSQVNIEDKTNYEEFLIYYKQTTDYLKEARRLDAKNEVDELLKRHVHLQDIAQGKVQDSELRKYLAGKIKEQKDKNDVYYWKNDEIVTGSVWKKPDSSQYKFNISETYLLLRPYNSFADGFYHFTENYRKKNDYLAIYYLIIFISLTENYEQLVLLNQYRDHFIEYMDLLKSNNGTKPVSEGLKKKLKRYERAINISDGFIEFCWKQMKPSKDEIKDNKEEAKDSKDELKEGKEEAKVSKDRNNEGNYSAVNVAVLYKMINAQLPVLPQQQTGEVESKRSQSSDGVEIFQQITKLVSELTVGTDFNPAVCSEVFSASGKKENREKFEKVAMLCRLVNKNSPFYGYALFFTALYCYELYLRTSNIVYQGVVKRNLMRAIRALGEKGKGISPILFKVELFFDLKNDEEFSVGAAAKLSRMTIMTLDERLCCFYFSQRQKYTTKTPELINRAQQRQLDLFDLDKESREKVNLHKEFWHYPINVIGGMSITETGDIRAYMVEAYNANDWGRRWQFFEDALLAGSPDAYYEYGCVLATGVFFQVKIPDFPIQLELAKLQFEIAARNNHPQAKAKLVEIEKALAAGKNEIKESLVPAKKTDGVDDLSLGGTGTAGNDDPLLRFYDYDDEDSSPRLQGPGF